MTTPVHHRPVVVYGANGFIGRNLCLRLGQSGAEVIAVSRHFDEGFRRRLPANVRCETADFADTRALRALPGSRGAVHVMLVSDSVPSTYMDEPSSEVTGNLLSHVRFFEGLEPDNRVVYLSSGGTVYGVPEAQTPITEDQVATNPISAYGVTKLAIEKYLSYTARIRGFDYCVLRPSNPVGPWTRPDSAQGIVSVLLESFLAGRQIHIWGDGSATRDYVDVRDLADAIITVARAAALPNTVYNVGSGIGRSINDVIASVSAALEIAPDVLFEPGRLVDVPYNVLDASRLRRDTGWAPAIEFDNTIRDTWHFISNRHNVKDML